MNGRSDTRLGVITAVFALGFCAFVFSGTFQHVTAPGGTRAAAVFNSTARLAKGMPVRVGGVVVGRVDKVGLDPGKRSATVQMILQHEALPLYRDARADLRWRTALGANYSIELDRGSPAAGRLADLRIPESRTSSQVEVDQILSAIQAPERSGLKTTLTELPRALADKRQPAGALSALANASPQLSRGLSAVRGQQRGDLARLVANTARTVAAMSAEPARVSDLIEGGAGTVAVTARRSGDIQRTIADSAAVLPRVTNTLQRLDHTLQVADPVIADLRSAAPAVAPTLTRLRPAVTEADALLADAKPLVQRLRPAAKALAGAARAARPLVDELQPILARVDERILADLAKPDPVSGRPTYQMLGPTVASLDAAAAGYDSVSHFVTLTPGGGERAIDSLPCRTYFGQPHSPKSITCESLDQLLHGMPPLGPQMTKRSRP
jgi:phospholipid/cholesterol/gamma-HCH transport system substrate-binding protein